MVQAHLAELLEALGAVLVVVGLVFWSLTVALITAGVFLLVVANAPSPGRPVPATPPRGARAEARR